VGTDNTSVIETYYARTCMGTGNLKWLKANISGTSFIVEVPYGLNKA
jgi:hypothetical protein